MRDKYISKAKNILITLAFPLAAWLLMEAITLLFAGKHVFASDLDIKNFIRNVAISVCTALALSFNLGSGRFDLSLGAQRMAATIIGANFAIKMGFGSIGVLLCALIAGILFGFIAGLIFVTTRVPPMVLGVGMAMVYECVAFVGSNAEGIQLFGKGYDSLAEIEIIIAVVLISVLLIMILLRYTSFGYHLRAIRGSQLIAKNSGINIFAHAAACYTLAGGLVSFSGVFDAAYKGMMNAEIGLSSSASVMTNCFPMFLGGFMSRWSNQATGILMATITLRIVDTGLSALKFDITTSQLINMALFLGFLVFTANQNFFQDRKKLKNRLAQAREKKATLQTAAA